MEKHVRRAHKNTVQQRGSKKKRRKRRLKRAVRTAFKILLSVAAVILLSVLISEVLIRVEMPEETALEMYYETDGTATLSWPAVARAGHYTVEVFSGDDTASARRTIFSDTVTDPSCSLPANVIRENVITIQLNTERNMKLFGRQTSWKGRRPLHVVCRPQEPVTDDLHVLFDSDTKTMSVYWGGYQGDGYRLYLTRADGTREIAAEETQTDELRAIIAFGETGRFPVPARGETLSFSVRAMRVAEQIVCFGKEQAVAGVVRDDLLAKRITVTSEAAGKNRFQLSWNESAGEGYAVQMKQKRTDEWITLAEIGETEERIFETPYLPPGSTHLLRVIPLGGKIMADAAFAAEPGETEVVTEIAPLYATIWPMKELTVYRDGTKNEKAGSVPAGGALCVLGEAAGMFRIMTNDGTEGYIDSTACMINLPEYVGENCLYDITNSYACIYRVQGYAMPGLTGTAIPGDEHEVLADGTFVVPLLYPVAKDFLNIMDAAKQDGYIFKIYSAFRPLVATNYLYNTTAGFLNKQLPEKTWDRITIDEYLLNGPKAPTPEELPQEETVPAPDDAEEGVPAALPGAAEAAPDPNATYHFAMTNGVYSLNWFFASGANSHNFGTAIDLTIADLETGVECEMQSPIHELSWLSTLDRNNEHSDRLQKYMKDGGYATLFSEWWHFQDNDAHGKYGIGALKNGITIAGWKKDDTGWKYRKEDGAFFVDESAEIDGKTYRFDERGYTERE